MTTIQNRPKKSVQLTKAQFKKLEKWVKEQPTKIDAAELLGTERHTLDRVLIKKSCSPQTLEKITAIIHEKQ